PTSALFPYTTLFRSPLSTQACSASNTAGCFNDGGVLGRIPANRLYQPGLALLKMLPKPNAPGNVGFNYQSQISDSYPRRVRLRQDRKSTRLNSSHLG